MVMLRMKIQWQLFSEDCNAKDINSGDNETVTLAFSEDHDVKNGGDNGDAEMGRHFTQTIAEIIKTLMVMIVI